MLIVDDNDTHRRILDETLRAVGLRADARGGRQGGARRARRGAAGREAFDLLLVDVHMPDIDGFTLLELARARHDLGGAVVVMLTSDRQPGDLDRCRELRASRRT